MLIRRPDTKERLLQARTSIGKAILQLMAVRDDPILKSQINRTIDKLGEMRKQLLELAEGK